MAAGRGDDPPGLPLSIGTWWEAARPRTLVAAVVPVLAGTAAATAAPDLARFLLALTVALALQVGVNYANDYFDGVRGVDTPDRIGPRRATASGLVSPGAMRAAIGLCVAIAVAAGLVLAALVSWWLVLVGLASVLAMVGYSGGPRPYASSGLGEVFVFVFFGLVPTVFSAFVQDGRFTLLPVAVSVPVGLLAVAIILANNIRDIPTDAPAGKQTLAVRLGRQGAQRLFAGVVAGAFLGLLPVVLAAGSPWPLLALVALPLAMAPIRLVQTRQDGPGMIQALVATARLQLAVGLLLTAGLALGRWLSATP